jgi:aspartyl/asparaginyl beta-hydroxylase (cupin superfamily)
VSEGSVSSLTSSADAALSAGNVSEAKRLLTDATNKEERDPALWLRLAAVNRAAGDPVAALAAVTRALAISPLDFTALLMRANLLDRLAPSQAPEAWSQALAQRPEGQLPPQVAAMIELGERKVEQWRAAREERMSGAVAQVTAGADDDQRRRLHRFQSNVLRRTRPYHSSPTHFHYPELVEREFHPKRLFPWIEALEAATDEIAGELEQVLNAERAELVPYIQYDDHLPLDQWRPLNHSPDWTAIHLVRNGQEVEANARHCPRTMEVLRDCHQPRVPGASPNAMFSLLAPGTSIPPHVGVNNTRLVCHLPLIVPEGCWFRVGAETRHWKRGEAFVFDDTIEHEALNPSDQLRIVFIFDTWHPDLHHLEREAIAALIAADSPDAAASL